MDNNPEVFIAKKKIQKEITNELMRKGVINFGEYSNIIKNLDEDIIRLENKLYKKKDMKNIIVKVPI